MKKKNSAINKIQKDTKAENKMEASKAVNKESSIEGVKKVDSPTASVKAENINVGKEKSKKAGKFTYKNVSSITLDDKKKIESFLKKENARVSTRMKERGIKISDIVKISKFHQQQFLNGTLKSDSIRYWFFLKNDNKQMFNFSKSHTANKK